MVQSSADVCGYVCFLLFGWFFCLFVCFNKMLRKIKVTPVDFSFIS